MQPHRIFSHRGNGVDGNKGRNSLVDALAQGFSLELDIRLAEGEVIVSHDPISRIDEHTVLFSDFLEQATNLMNHEQTLAINIKQDGLLPFLNSVDLSVRHFFFDMSVPQLVQYWRAGRQVALRNSELESAEDLLMSLPMRQGTTPWVWADSFFGSSENFPAKARHASVNTVFVSPELHGRGFEGFATVIGVESMHAPEFVHVCTDYPETYLSF